MKELAYLLILASLLYSHSGRTDSNGGHYNRSTGEYHFHNQGTSTDYQNQSSQYVISIFKNKSFIGLGETFSSKQECMNARYNLWIQNKDNGYTYGCRKQ